MKVNLVLLKVGGNNKSFMLPSEVTIVGRRQDCDLCIPLMVISRRHCAIDMDDGQLCIRDLGSSNGTFVNGKRIEEKTLSPGDKITIGPLTFVVQIDGKPEEIKGDQELASQSEVRARVTTDNADLKASPSAGESKQDLHSTEIIGIPPSE